MQTPTAQASARVIPAKQPKLLDRVRDAVRTKHYSLSTEKTYVQWCRRFILFHGKRHPRDMGAREVEQFLNHQHQQTEILQWDIGFSRTKKPDGAQLSAKSAFRRYQSAMSWAICCTKAQCLP